MQHDPRCGAILCAAEEELAPFLPHLAEEQGLSLSMLTLHIGRIGGLRISSSTPGRRAACPPRSACSKRP